MKCKSLIGALALAPALIVVPSWGTQGDITTVAGRFSGEMPAIQMDIAPVSVSVDTAGTRELNRVRHV
jgi:hypothetical protein